MNTNTPETDAAYIQRPNEGSWDFKVRQEKVMEKLELERDALRASMREILACSLNCKDSLDEAEQMERIAKESLDIL